MRRLSNITKETALWARSRIVGINELAEAQRESLDKEQYEELELIYSSIKKDIKDGLLKVFSYEIQQLKDSFNLGESDLTKKGGAFPGIECLDESIIEYAVDLTADITELFTIPAVAIVDEAEDWINELWTHHELNGKSGI